MKKILQLLAAVLVLSPATHAALIYDESMFPGGDFLNYSNPDSFLSIGTLALGLTLLRARSEDRR